MINETWTKNHSIRLIAAVILLVVCVALVQAAIGIMMEGAVLLEGAVAVILFLGVSCLFQGAIALLTSAPIWYFGRHHVGWTAMDHAVLVVPWATWALLVLLVRHDKSFVNMILEGTAVGLAAPLATLFRLAVGPHLREGYATAASLVVCVGVSAAVWTMVPFLGE